MKYVRWLEAKLSTLLSWWCMALMGILALGMILSVALRYVFGITFVWAEASITMVFLGTTYFGAALGVKENEHICIDYLSERLPPRLHVLSKILVMLVILVVEGVVFKTSLTWIAKVGSTMDVALNLPKSYFYMMVPISAAIMILYALVKIIRYLGDKEGCSV